VAHFGRGKQIALRNEFEPVRYVVVYRAFPLAVRVATGQAALGLNGCGVSLELSVNLAKVKDSLSGGQLVRISSGGV